MSESACLLVKFRGANARSHVDKTLREFSVPIMELSFRLMKSKGCSKLNLFFNRGSKTSTRNLLGSRIRRLIADLRPSIYISQVCHRYFSIFRLWTTKLVEWTFFVFWKIYTCISFHFKVNARAKLCIQTLVYKRFEPRTELRLLYTILALGTQ